MSENVNNNQNTQANNQVSAAPKATTAQPVNGVNSPATNTTASTVRPISSTATVNSNAAINPNPQPNYNNVQYANPNVNYSKSQIPPAYKPLSPWAYFGYNLLFSVPLIGFIMMVVFSFDDSNLNRRNFARSFFCAMIIGLVIGLVFLLIVAIIAVVSGISLFLIGK